MRVECVKGVKLNSEIISEEDLKQRGILSIEDFFTSYVDRFGFSVNNVFDYKKGLVTITCNNVDYIKKYGYLNFTYNYKTGEVSKGLDKPDHDTDLKPHKVELRHENNKTYVLIDNSTILCKDEVRIISSSLISYRENGIYYIYDINDKKAYPIVYFLNYATDKDFNLSFKDKDGTIGFVRLLDDDIIDFLLSNFNYVMTMNNTAHKFDVIYGIKTSENGEKYYWFNDLKSRDDKYNEILTSVFGVLDNSDVKVKVNTDKK